MKTTYKGFTIIEEGTMFAIYNQYGTRVRWADYIWEAKELIDEYLD